jgi:hypothetical protein
LNLEELTGWSVMDAEKVKHYRPPPTQRHFAHLYVCWEEADKTLVRDFRRWLKGNRPFPAKTRRGRSSAREFMADLKALGAYRLMRVMGVVAAMEHTARIRRGNPLFLKRPDWYKAQRRARAVIERYFDRG